MAIDTVSGFNSTDTLDFSDLPFKTGASATYNTSTEVLTVKSGNQTDRLRLTDTDVRQFLAEEDAAGDTKVVALCFASGTKIRTSRGEIAVEYLAAGDLAITVSGAFRPIVWIGRRELNFGADAGAFASRPIRVAEGAFGIGKPVRDLFLSPGHPVLVGADADNEGGLLVPIMCLVNGTTIARMPVDTVTYWHVELDQHDILLAEGLPAESYIDLGSRPWFAGADGALYDPDIALPGMPDRCRPVALDGPLVEAERRRLDAVFTTTLVAAAAWPSVEDALAF